MSVPKIIYTKPGYYNSRKDKNAFYIWSAGQSILSKSALKEVRVAKDLEEFDKYYIIAKEESKKVFIDDWKQIGLSIPIVIVQFNYYLYGNNDNKNLSITRIGDKLGTFFASNAISEKQVKVVEEHFGKNLVSGLKYFNTDFADLKSFKLHKFLTEDQNIPDELKKNGYGLELGEVEGKKTIDISPKNIAGKEAGYIEALPGQRPPIVLLKTDAKKVEYSWDTGTEIKPTEDKALQEAAEAMKIAEQADLPTGGFSADFKNLCDIILAETIKSYLL